MEPYTIEDIELLRQKSGISYQEAVALLDYHNGSVARALIDLEKHGRLKNEDHTQKEGTNLGIIQRYFDSIKPEDTEVIRLKRWTNCNIRADYLTIKNNWEYVRNEHFTEKT